MRPENRSDRQIVTHAHALGLEIPQIEIVGGRFQRNGFHDLKSVALQTDAFHGIIAHQAHFLHTYGL